MEILQWKSHEYTFNNTLNSCKGHVPSACLIRIYSIMEEHDSLWKYSSFNMCIYLIKFLQFSLRIFWICNSAFNTDRDLEPASHREIPRVQIYWWNYAKNKLEHEPQRHHSQGYELLAKLRSICTLVISIYFSFTWLDSSTWETYLLFLKEYVSISSTFLASLLNICKMLLIKMELAALHVV